MFPHIVQGFFLTYLEGVIHSIYTQPLYCHQFNWAGFRWGLQVQFLKSYKHFFSPERQREVQNMFCGTFPCLIRQNNKQLKQSVCSMLVVLNMTRNCRVEARHFRRRSTVWMDLTWF